MFRNCLHKVWISRIFLLISIYHIFWHWVDFNWLVNIPTVYSLIIFIAAVAWLYGIYKVSEKLFRLLNLNFYFETGKNQIQSNSKHQSDLKPGRYSTSSKISLSLSLYILEFSWKNWRSLKFDNWLKFFWCNHFPHFFLEKDVVDDWIFNLQYTFACDSTCNLFGDCYFVFRSSANRVRIIYTYNFLGQPSHSCSHNRFVIFHSIRIQCQRNC